MLIVVFNGSTSMLIPLYAIGVFLSFTMSQAGMAVRWQLMTATANILQQASDRHLFTTLANVHPLTIGTWVKIGGVAPTQELAVGGAKMSYTIEETEHVLLR